MRALTVEHAPRIAKTATTNKQTDRLTGHDVGVLVEGPAHCPLLRAVQPWHADELPVRLWVGRSCRGYSLQLEW